MVVGVEIGVLVLEVGVVTGAVVVGVAVMNFEKKAQTSCGIH